MQQSITLNIPSGVYDRLRQAAEQRHRSVNDLVLEAIAAAAPALDEQPTNLMAALAQMAYLNDAALWQAARSTIAPTLRERSEALHAKQQRESLTGIEQAEIEQLEQLYRDTVLVRAQATVLLKQRGYDVADPSQFSPLD